MRKALIVSYDINPNIGSEATKAHYWLLAICKYFDIDVFVHSQHRETIEKYPYPDNIKFICANASPKKKDFWVGFVVLIKLTGFLLILSKMNLSKESVSGTTTLCIS